MGVLVGQARPPVLVQARKECCIKFVLK